MISFKTWDGGGEGVSRVEASKKEGGGVNWGLEALEEGGIRGLQGEVGDKYLFFGHSMDQDTFPG